MQPNLTNEILREYFRRSFYNFFKTCWSQVETGEYSDNFHIKLLCDELQKRYGYWDDYTNVNFTDNMFYVDLLTNQFRKF